MKNVIQFFGGPGEAYNVNPEAQKCHEDPPHHTGDICTTRKKNGYLGAYTLSLIIIYMSNIEQSDKNLLS